MSRNTLLILLAATGVLLVASACSGPQEVVDVPTTMPTTDPGRCPIKIPGAKAVTADTAQGITITYTTDDGSVEDLQQRVAFLGEEHNKLAARTTYKDPEAPTTVEPTDGKPARKMAKPGDAAPLPVSGRKMAPMATATVENIENGAKITLVPAGGTALEDLKAHVTRRAEAMAKGECMLPSLNIPAAPAPAE